MKIAIDCRMIDASGVGTYLKGCLPWLLKSQNHFLLLGDSAKLQPFAASVQNTVIAECTVKCFSLQELFFFPSDILQKINGCDCYFSPFFNIPGHLRIPVHTTIHDIIFPDMPELISKAGLAMRMWFYRRAFNRSQKIFTVSEFSKSRIEYYSRHKVPVVVTHDAVHKKILKNSNVTGDKSETIVFLGNIKKHKGLDCLLEAFINAKACGLPHKLVIIGNKDNFRSADKDFLEKIESLGGDSVIFTGFVSDERLCEYLSCAALLVQPSLYEGFGLPPLEAMFLGTRALISDIPVFKEIYRDFPVTFFKAGDAEDLKQKLMELLLNRKPERIILSESLKSKYSFEKTAAVILQELPS